MGCQPPGAGGPAGSPALMARSSGLIGFRAGRRLCGGAGRASRCRPGALRLPAALIKAASPWPAAERAPGVRMLQLRELGARDQDPPLMRAEVHEHSVVFCSEYHAEPVLIVRHLIADGERLGRGRRSWGAERAVGQITPGRGAGCLHSYIMRLPCPAAGVSAAGLRCRTHHDLVWGSVDDALQSVRCGPLRRAPVVHRSASELVSTDVAAREGCGHLSSGRRPS